MGWKVVCREGFVLNKRVGWDCLRRRERWWRRRRDIFDMFCWDFWIGEVKKLVVGGNAGDGHAVRLEVGLP